jgi:hypothetical protein
MVAATLAAQAPPAVTAFTHVNVVDVTDGEVIRDRTVIVRNRHIDAIEPSESAALPSNATTVEGSGKFLVPGLWDAHVHTRYDGIDHLRLLIAHGVTSARDLGGGWEHLGRINQWNQEIAAGKRIGPRIVAAGVVLDGPKSVWSHTALISTPDEGRAAVNRLKAEGASYVKVYMGLSRPSFEAIVDEAKRQQLIVGGHVIPSVGIFDATTLGQSAVEHAADLLPPLSASEELLRKARDEGRPPSITEVVKTFSDDKAKRLAQHFRKHQVRLVPTLSLYASMLGVAGRDSGTIDSSELRFVPPAYLSRWRSAEPMVLADAQARADGAVRVMRHMIDAGVDILAGTDVVKTFFLPGKSLHDELSLLVKAGFTPLQALRAATSAPAEYLGIKDSTTIAPGQRADLVLLDADPLQDINNIRRIAGVMANGAFYARQGLDDMLRHVEREAAAWKGTPTGR